MQSFWKRKWSGLLLINLQFIWKTIFPSWNVDCEYNKVGSGINSKHDSSGFHKRPDIVIHKRERVEIENNLLVIEIKMNTNDSSDEQKLKDFTGSPNQERPFQYKNGLKIIFGQEIELKWFRNGQQADL